MLFFFHILLFYVQSSFKQMKCWEKVRALYVPNILQPVMLKISANVVLNYSQNIFYV